MFIKKMCTFFCLLACVLFFIQPAWAENPGSNDTPWEKFSVNLGYFISHTNTDFRIGSGLGVDVNVEDLLGLNATNSVFRVDASWRFTENRRHRLDFTWFSYHRDGSRTIGQDIEYEDNNGNIITIPAGSQVASKFDLDIYKAAYSYSFFQDKRMDLAASIGLYVMPIDIDLDASGLVDVNEEENFTAPLPTFGLRADFAITPKWFLRSGFEIFYLEVKQFRGAIVGSNVALEYLPWKHVGFGLGFNSFNLNIQANGEDYPQIDFRGNIKFNYAGLLLYAKMFF